MQPSAQVLAAFGAPADAVRLAGGEGTTWRAGQIVVKPAGPPHVARWTAGLYQALSSRQGPGFRVPRPVRSATGDWVADGWVAWEVVSGEPASLAGTAPCWPRLVAVSRAFHAALAGLPAPRWLGRDGSRWTLADQVAWGERDPGELLASGPDQPRGQVASLLAALRPVRLPAQLIHGDLRGNVLFAAGEPPAVIDFSPYWRPAGLATAVAAVDALTWDGASPAILDELAGEPELPQLLARAHITRLVTEMIARRAVPGLEEVASTGQPVTELILDRLA
jgi:uncharacterized protein (TIGR02569 family)